MPLSRIAASALLAATISSWGRSPTREAVTGELAVLTGRFLILDGSCGVVSTFPSSIPLRR
jgi:hypothetical protein